MAMTVKISTFYKFVAIDDCVSLRAAIHSAADERGVLGTILVAHEGINATISADAASLDEFVAWLRSDRRFADLQDKQSRSAAHPFGRLKVKVKPEIVTLGAAGADPREAIGTYVEPEAWNALIQDPNVVVVDTRNSYEVAIGTFEGARDPGTRSFSELPDYVSRELAGDKSRPVAMFCTGGIRCEKATAYLIDQGFENVFHLRGGILNYLAKVPAQDSLWRGECFVFDDRVAVDHDLAPGGNTRCGICGQPLAAKCAGDDGAAVTCCVEHTALA